MISKTNCSIGIIKKVIYVHLIGSKVVLYPLLFQQFPIKHRDHLPFYYDQYLGYSRVRVFADLTHFHILWIQYYFYHCADWSLNPCGVKTVN